MKIIDGKKFYKADMERAKCISNDGWNSYNGQNWQWYWLKYDAKTGYTMLEANNSGDCYGDYSDRDFASPESFAEWCREHDRSWEKLLGEIDENDEAAMDFVDRILGKSHEEA